MDDIILILKINTALEIITPAHITIHGIRLYMKKYNGIYKIEDEWNEVPSKFRHKYGINFLFCKKDNDSKKHSIPFIFLYKLNSNNKPLKIIKKIKGNITDLQYLLKNQYIIIKSINVLNAIHAK